jgi:hypothetical protein
VPTTADDVFLSPFVSINLTLDGSVTVNSIVVGSSSTLNLGSYTLTLTSTTKPFDIYSSIGGTGTIKLIGDADIEISGGCQSAAHTIPNLIMGPITAPRTVTLGHTSCEAIFQVNGNFISGSSASAMVSFAKGHANSNITNSVTSYWCASNGGITNIDCQAGAPPATPPPISASVESDLAFALTFLGIVLIAAFKLRKARKA